MTKNLIQTEIMQGLNRLLQAGEVVGKNMLAAHMGMTTEALSYHLPKMVEAGLIVLQKKGTNFTSPVVISLPEPVDPAELAAPSLVDDLVPAGVGINAAEIGIGMSLEPKGPLPVVKGEQTHSPSGPLNLCRRCQKNPEVIDSRGHHMGECSDCLRSRSRANLAEGHKYSGAGIPIPLRHPKNTELLDWLKKEAEENEREIPQQVIYLLKQVYRAALQNG